jgi:hypothetical protein
VFVSPHQLFLDSIRDVEGYGANLSQARQYQSFIIFFGGKLAREHLAPTDV